jgi:hypothetical protein
MRAIVAAAVTLASATLLAAQSPARRPIVVRGVITDSATGRKLERARIFAGVGNDSAIANTSGEYLLKIDAANSDTAVRLRVTRVGYVRQSCTVRLSRDTIRADYALPLASLHIREITLTKRGPTVNAYEAGSPTARLSTDSLRKCS